MTVWKSDPAMEGWRRALIGWRNAMMENIVQEHLNDAMGYPAGGSTRGIGFLIDWQVGPLRVDGEEREQTGAFVEDVICAAVGRIEYYQATPFHCIHNAVALGHLKAALEALRERTRDRQDRGVEGTHQT